MNGIDGKLPETIAKPDTIDGYSRATMMFYFTRQPDHMQNLFLQNVMLESNSVHIGIEFSSFSSNSSIFSNER